MRKKWMLAAVALVLVVSPSQACDLGINDADLLAQKLSRYFERAFAAGSHRCNATPATLKCYVKGTQINVNFDRHEKLDIALLSAGGRTDVLKALWAEVSPHVYFGAFDKPSDTDIAAAIEGRGPRIFIQQDHCALVFDQKLDDATFIVSGGYRK